MLLYMFFLQEGSVRTIPPPHIQAKSVITPAILVNFLVFIKTPLKPTIRLFFDFEAFNTTFVNATHKKLCWINLPTSICATYIKVHIYFKSTLFYCQIIFFLHFSVIEFVF